MSVASQDAIERLTRELAADPDDAGLLHARGRAWHRLGDNERAIADYDRARALGLRTAALHNDLGVAWWHRGSDARALEGFNAALELDPDHPLALINRGDWHEKRGDLTRAAADFARVIDVQTAVLEKRPHDLAALTMRGAAANRAGRLEDALVDLNRAADLPDPTTKVFRHRGEVLLKRGRAAEALADLDRCLESDPGNPIVLSLRDSATAALKGRTG